MSEGLKSKLSRLEAKIQPQTDKEAEEQKQRSEALDCLLKELIELSRLEAIEDRFLTPQQRYDKELAETEELVAAINKHTKSAGLQ
jgi:acetate kinase